MATLPVYTQTIDDAFVETWYEIRPDAVDNILDALVIWVALRDRGVMESQVGGTFISRDIKYGNQGATNVEKGDTLPSGEPELETQALWKWKYCASHVQRSTIDDQQNAGPEKRKGYVAKRLKDARDGIEQKYESSLWNAFDSAETAKTQQGLLDLIPTNANKATGTWGGIARSNTWWQPKYLQTTSPEAVNLVSDMKSMFNTIFNNQIAPDLIITTQDWFEIYEEFGLDASQIIKNPETRVMDLGFQSLFFKGAELIWSANTPATTMRFLTTQFMEIVWDPNLWFDMTEFKPIPLQMERIAHIMSAYNMIGTQPRRFGLLYQ